MRCDVSRVGEQDRQTSDFAFLHTRCEPATSNSTYDHLSTSMHEAHPRRINAPSEGHALRIAIARESSNRNARITCRMVISLAFSLTPTNEASQVNHSSYQRDNASLVSQLLADIARFQKKKKKITFHRSDLISIINSCLSLELQEKIQCNGRQRLGRNYQFRNKAAQCSGRERARKGASEHMDRTASTRAYERHPCAARLCCLAVPEFVIRPHVHGA